MLQSGGGAPIEVAQYVGLQAGPICRATRGQHEAARVMLLAGQGDWYLASIHPKYTIWTRYAPGGVPGEWEKQVEVIYS